MMREGTTGHVLGVYKKWFKTETGRSDPSETSRQKKPQ